jgi:type II secretory ATPase GspE/PulE/Tfp pilus assembly ATPase PilB-like protein
MLLASSINLIIAQRLVRKICQKCKKEIVPPRELVDQLNLPPSDTITNSISVRGALPATAPVSAAGSAFLNFLPCPKTSASSS